MTYKGFSGRTSYARWGLLAVAVGMTLGGTIPTALAAIGRAIAIAPSSMPWYTERVVAFLAYLALAGSVVYGLLLSTKILDAIAHRPITFTLHQDLASIGLGLGAIHGALLGLDRTVPFSPAAILLPLAAPYRPVLVAAGQVSLYLVVAVVASFYARRRIGQRAWRAVHYLTFLAFLGVTVHGIGTGTDSATPWAGWIYGAATAVVAFLFAYRITLSVARRLTRGHASSIRPSPSPFASQALPSRPLPARRPAPATD